MDESEEGWTTPGELYEAAIEPEPRPPDPPEYLPLIHMSLPMVREVMEWQSEKALRMLDDMKMPRPRWRSE